MSDAEGERASSRVECGICGRTQHRMDTFAAPAFDFEQVCISCVCDYLETGEWEQQTDEYRGP